MTEPLKEMARMPRLELAELEALAGLAAQVAATDPQERAAWTVATRP
jgi:hypothetical protein